VKSKTIVVTLFLVSFIFAVNLAYASTVRGRIVKRQTQVRENPVPNIPVTLCNRTGDDCSSPVHTDTEGMYYFYNVPAGDYVLKVWANGYNVGEPCIHEIQGLNQEYTDIEKKFIPCP
jgi:hypothetical protein